MICPDARQRAPAWRQPRVIATARPPGEELEQHRIELDVVDPPRPVPQELADQPLRPAAQHQRHRRKSEF